MNIPRILIAAPSSGSGKTVISCGLMAAFCRQQKNVVSCKCGPDYIDINIIRSAFTGNNIFLLSAKRCHQPTGNHRFSASAGRCGN